MVSRNCHSERSEESHSKDRMETLRSAQGDITEVLLECFSTYIFSNDFTLIIAFIYNDLIDFFTLSLMHCHNASGLGRGTRSLEPACYAFNIKTYIHAEGRHTVTLNIPSSKPTSTDPLINSTNFCTVCNPIPAPPGRRCVLWEPL